MITDAEEYRLLQAEAMLNTYRRWLKSRGMEEESLGGLAGWALEHLECTPVIPVEDHGETIVKGFEGRWID